MEQAAFAAQKILILTPAINKSPRVSSLAREPLQTPTRPAAHRSTAVLKCRPLSQSNINEADLRKFLKYVPDSAGCPILVLENVCAHHIARLSHVVF